MSRLKEWDSYKKTRAYRFFRWYRGEKDPFLGEVEMKEGKLYKDTRSEEEIQKEKEELMNKVYDIDHNKEIKFFKLVYGIISAVFCLALTFVLLLMVSYSPKTGNPGNPNENEVPARYIENGLQETGAVNIVTGMILDYRAFDTLGESHVLFIATITVFILLRIDKDEKGKEKDREEANDRNYEPKNDAILQIIAVIIVPLIIIFGIYVILNGHLSPGGGFSGGAIIGAGLILYLNAFGFAKTERFFTEKTYKIICFCSLSFYCLAKSYSFFMGANHLESGIPLGTPGAILSSGLILPLNICVGLVVACTMYAFYALFRKGGF